MNASYSPESSVQSTTVPDWPQNTRQAPSVPISVYRELATELKTTQALVDSLTQQNQQLGQQNQLLRQEMLKFAESAAHLKQAVEARPLFQLDANNPSYPMPETLREGSLLAAASGLEMDAAGWAEAESNGSPQDGVANLTHQVTQMLKPKAKVKVKNAKPPAKRPQPNAPQRMLYTEERLEPSRSSQLREKNTDLSGLWLATTIVLIVVSAFGAGFIIMKPLLNNSR